MFKKQSSLVRLRAALRQAAYPVEFRIAEPVWPDDIARQIGEALKRRTPHTVVKGLAEEQIIAVSTKLWRLRSDLEIHAGGHAGEALDRIRRHLETLWELLADGGVDIYDHTGQINPKGIPPWKIIAYQPIRSVTRERIIETVRPTIRFNGKIIQKGEVIVGTPEPNE